jgi:hypothetical protein
MNAELIDLIARAREHYEEIGRFDTVAGELLVDLVLELETLDARIADIEKGPKVKELEWKKRDGLWEAESLGLSYVVFHHQDDCYGMVNRNFGASCYNLRSLDEAKAAAQSDFQKRVRECLV